VKEERNILYTVNEERNILYTVNEERNILYKVKRRQIIGLVSCWVELPAGTGY
jgi:hypothetical protein